ncbi:hypothetical protein D3C85_1819310 [compost metagenome]
MEKVETSRIEMVKVKSAPVVDLKCREFLTVRQAAQLLSSSPKAIYNMWSCYWNCNIKVETF